MDDMIGVDADARLRCFPFLAEVIRDELQYDEVVLLAMVQDLENGVFAAAVVAPVHLLVPLENKEEEEEVGEIVDNVEAATLDGSRSVEPADADFSTYKSSSADLKRV